MLSADTNIWVVIVLRQMLVIDRATVVHDKIIVAGLYIFIESIGLPIAIVHVANHLNICGTTLVWCSICGANGLRVVAMIEQDTQQKAPDHR